MTNPNFSASFVEHLEAMISELRSELAPYEAGTAHAGRRAGGAWMDITGVRIGQIKREIEALEDAIKRHKEWNTRA